MTSADLPALADLIVLGERAACNLDDISGDGKVDQNDLELLVHVIFADDAEG